MSDKETPAPDLMLTFAIQALEAYAKPLNLDLRKKEDRQIVQKDLLQAINNYLLINK